ncbi:MAG: hypothetical protein ACM3N0_03925 [Chloroflexota bacterium]
MVGRLACLCTAAAVALTLATAPALGAPADLDRSFGGDGIVDVEAPAGTTFRGDSWAQMALGPHDEIFVLSSTYQPCEPPFGCTVELTVARYSANGRRDRTYGAGAGPQVVVTQNAFSHSFDLAVGPDGKPAIAAIDGPSQHLVVARLDASGRLDPTFGSGGLVPDPLEAALTPRPAVAVQPDGGVVVSVAGGRVEGGEELRVARFLADGRRDPGFGTGGESRIVEPNQTRPADILIGPSGSISVPSPLCCLGGTRLFGEGFSLARFLADGQPDTRLAGSGRLFFPTPGAEGSVVAATQTRNGRVIVAFEESTERVSTVDNVAKITPSGALAPHFGRKGRLRLYPRVGSSGVSAIAVDAKGRLVGTGWSGRVNVFRLGSNGSRDRTFNGGQSVQVPYGNGGITDYSIAVQSGGRIVVLAEVGCCGESQGFALIGVRGGTSHIRCLGRRATIVGTRKADKLIGTPHRDVIAALGGRDEVRGLGGPDLICGGKGVDKLFGGAGRDEVKQ